MGQLLKLVGMLAAITLAATGHATALDFALFAGMYVLTSLGVTAGMHRLFAHRSYEAHPALRVVLAVLGSMAGQGFVIVWCAVHRRHHQHTDQPLDPHSPKDGLFHSHAGWILRFYPEGLARYVPDLLADPLLVKCHQRGFALILAGTFIPALIGGLATMSLWGALTGYIWGGWARMFAAEQATCMVNSLGHAVGTRPFETRDLSTNLGPLAVLIMGEGWHNNHHAFPTSARHGLRWWQLDVTYYAIRIWQSLGLASRVLVPDAGTIAARRRKVDQRAHQEPS